MECALSDLPSASELAESAAPALRLRDALNGVLLDQPLVVDRVVTAMLARGHVLLEGLPGLGKTELCKALAKLLGLPFRRIQFTPDLLPGDITGGYIYNRAENQFVLRKGPLFAHVVLADEINRASPRTQSALLQAMQEKHVTVAGARHDLPGLFHVLATQNPLEQEGTYPFPEAQLDRFLLQIDVGYPSLEAERRMLLATTMGEEKRAAQVCNPDDLMQAQALVRRLPVGESVVEAILQLVRSARPGPEAGEAGGLISWGPGPRASQALMLAVRARALLDGRFAPSVDDVLELAEPVLKHRMALTFSARAEGETIVNVIARLKSRIG